MFTIKDYARPETLEEAYGLLQARKNNVILGGCAFLKMSNKKISTAIDLSRLQLDFIHEHEDRIEIGAMTTFRALETHPCLLQYFSGVVPKSIGHILGVQFRNVVTVGGTLYSRYGFSDLITALLALDADVELYHGGRMSLEQFLALGSPKDILTKLILYKNHRLAAYQSMRKSASDYPLLTVAVSKKEEKWRIVVGARPRRAEMAKAASAYLSKHTVTTDAIHQASAMAVEELAFGSNMRGQKIYRETIAIPLIKRGIMEVLQWK